MKYVSQRHFSGYISYCIPGGLLYLTAMGIDAGLCIPDAVDSTGDDNLDGPNSIKERKLLGRRIRC